MPFRGHRFNSFLASKYLILLLALLSMMLAFPFMDERLFGKLLFDFSFLFIVVGIFYGLKQESHLWLFITMGVFAFIVNVAEMGFDELAFLSWVISILFYVYSIILFCKDIYTRKQITTDILIGSICVYLLIGITFALLYMLLQAMNMDTFLHSASSVPIHKRTDFYYFSFITLATVGFGDILPQTDIAKSIVLIEGIVGIFYIAIMVARLVAVFKIENE